MRQPLPSRDRVRGERIRRSLLAGALGDAWGGAYEGTVGPIVAPFPDRPRLSDDTWLTVATCEAIIRAGGRVEPATIARSFRLSFEDGRLRGLGSSTLKAVRDLAAGAHWALAGARGEYAAGAGAAMRIAPLAFVLNPVSADDRVLVRDVARITHHSDEAYAGAVPLALLVAAREWTSGLAGVLERAVALGGDTDTIASIAGQIVGASGLEAPQDLLRRIPDFARVESTVAQFVAQVAGD